MTLNEAAPEPRPHKNLAASHHCVNLIKHFFHVIRCNYSDLSGFERLAQLFPFV